MQAQARVFRSDQLHCRRLRLLIGTCRCRRGTSIGWPIPQLPYRKVDKDPSTSRFRHSFADSSSGCCQPSCCRLIPRKSPSCCQPSCCRLIPRKSPSCCQPSCCRLIPRKSPSCCQPSCCRLIPRKSQKLQFCNSIRDSSSGIEFLVDF